jgi:hypothetical protein
MTADTSRPVDQDQKIGMKGAAGQPQSARRGSDTKDFDIRIARDGNWYHQGSLIGRKALVKLFSTVLMRDESGQYWLITPAERGRIEVEDAPFTAVELSVNGQGQSQVLRFRTNLDEWVEAGADHPVRVDHAPDTGEPRPYILVRDGLDALIVRAVFYLMVELGVGRQHEGRNDFGVWSKGIFFSLGRIENPR